MQLWRRRERHVAGGSGGSGRSRQNCSSPPSPARPRWSGFAGNLTGTGAETLGTSPEPAEAPQAVPLCSFPNLPEPGMGGFPHPEGEPWVKVLCDARDGLGGPVGPR